MNTITKKLTFNQANIQKIQKLLHALPDSKLAEEVASLRLDFKRWIKIKFNLTLEELAFLDQLNKHFLTAAGAKASNLLALRKPIKFTVIEGIENPES